MAVQHQPRETPYTRLWMTIPMRTGVRKVHSGKKITMRWQRR